MKYAVTVPCHAVDVHLLPEHDDILSVYNQNDLYI